MRTGRHYLVVLLTTWIIIVIMGVYTFAETKRMPLAEERQLEHSLERGLELYARNCSVCHGPKGEGVVGLPLNPEYRKDFQGGPEQNKNAAELIRRTITDGRAGMGVPTWVTLPDGRMASYTAMPAWAREKGGPFNAMHIQDLVNFIMLGDFNKVMGKVTEIDRGTVEAVERSMEKGKTIDDVLTMRDAPGLTPAENKRGQELFKTKGCVTCHRIGSRGGSVGPDLSYVGSWGVSSSFLKEWIRNPAAKENRIPSFWRESTFGPQIDTSKKPVDIPPTVMPGMGLNDQELDDLVKYLSGLTVKK